MRTTVGEVGITGVFSAEGDSWRRQRMLAMTALNAGHLQRYFRVVTTATERLQRRLQSVAESGKPVDISRELTSLTVDVTSALAFGYDLNTLERGDVELQQHIQFTFQMLARRLFSVVPYWRWVRLRADRKLDRTMVELQRAVAEFIAQARERMAARPELRDSPENLLEAMLAAQGTGGAFSDEEIAGNVLTFLLAGEDTTAHTMSWTLWFLASRPEIQERWAREACAALGDALYPDTYEAVAELDYGEAVLRESMRLKPVAPFQVIEAAADVVVSGVEIPANTQLWLVTRRASLQHTERSGDFDPARWLDKRNGPEQPAAGGYGPQRAAPGRDALGGSQPGAPDQRAFLTFGAGPRFCPGRNLAFLESKAAMAMIARNFAVELDEREGPVTDRLSFTLVPEGLRVRLRRREQMKPAVVLD
jgi:cytochrome P450